jgi:acetylornithine deacetylase
VRRWPVAYPISVGTVHAGDWASTVPDLCVAEGRLGVALDETPAQARAALEAAVAAACATDPWLADHPATVEWWGGQFGSGRSDDPALLDRIVAAHRLAVPGGPAPETYGAPYGSDLRLLAPHQPTVQFGPGDTRDAHAPDEAVPAAQLHEATRTIALFYLAHCGVL